MAELNDLPIKTVGSTTIYIRDVAYVRDGFPPQTNIVRVDGQRAALLTIQKTGNASTLDIISGVKAMLPRIKAPGPAGTADQAAGGPVAFSSAPPSTAWCGKD